MTTTSTAATSSLEGFTSHDFDVFQLQGLEERMLGIQERIQPKFRALGERLTAELAPSAGKEMHLHIARHARRKVNPPKDTWLAICDNKRGYKAHPHFQLGLFDDHLFMWLALIYEVPNKKGIAAHLMNHLDEVRSAVPADYVLSMDHMKKDCTVTGGMSEEDWKSTLIRFRDVQKAELLIGRHVVAGGELLQDGDALLAYASSTYEQLMPIYRMACSV
ncbi:DUF1054 domain-containing protein [Paenibacillus sp. 1011MAR3C5]|uniref:DUF1054 domain-containing protein n=1 Tax=Paenibacillus sp. 1011MAR3C5 TaxID=1675787 RepID=UPI000E6B7C1E|nr:DUF1054 domain-containing protein [Paenibacillus sp. 1011MAR3C5]RJE90614.1 DUF1054 domain-containing protein [Paenibacillus sp. 1011MAR3C5]